MSVDPLLVQRLLPLTEYVAYSMRVDRQEDRVIRVRDFYKNLPSDLRALFDQVGAGQKEVQLLDLHGLRARDAKAALETCTEPVCVVWFGKGGGVLREVFLAFVARQPQLVLVDMSGETQDRPQEAVGLLLRRDLYDALVLAIRPQPVHWSVAIFRLLGQLFEMFFGKK